MMRPFLTIRHPILLASRAFASRGNIRLRRPAIARCADHNAPSIARSVSAKGNFEPEPDNTVDESARTLRKNEAKGKTPTVEITPVLPSLDELCFEILPPLRETERILQEESRILEKDDQILEDKDRVLIARGWAAMGETYSETDDTEDESEAKGETPTGEITPMLPSIEKWIFTYPPEREEENCMEMEENRMTKESQQESFGSHRRHEEDF